MSRNKATEPVCKAGSSQGVLELHQSLQCQTFLLFLLLFVCSVFNGIVGLNSCCNVPTANILMYGQAQYKKTVLLLLLLIQI